ETARRSAPVPLRVAVSERATSVTSPAGQAGYAARAGWRGISRRASAPNVTKIRVWSRIDHPPAAHTPAEVQAVVPHVRASAQPARVRRAFETHAGARVTRQR